MEGQGAMRAGPKDPLDTIYGDSSTTQRWYDRSSGLYSRFAEDLEFPPTALAIEELGFAGDETVIDLGCGAGRAVTEIGGKLDSGGVALGVDFAPGMCREARDTIHDARVGDRAGIVCGDVTDLPVRTDSVDVAISSFVLDLLSPNDIDAALNEMRRVLVPDGRVAIVSLAQSGSIPTRAYRTLRRIFPTQMDCRPIPLVDLLETGGFEVDWRTEYSLFGLPVTIATATV